MYASDKKFHFVPLCNREPPSSILLKNCLALPRLQYILNAPGSYSHMEVALVVALSSN